MAREVAPRSPILTLNSRLPSPDSLLLLGELRQVFGNPLFEAGERLADAGCVQDVRILQAGRIVTGVAVPAPPGAKLRVYIQYPSQAGASQQMASRPMTGECSCGESGPCVHVAAVCIVAAKQAHGVGRAQRSAAAIAIGERSTPGTLSQQRLYYRLQPPEAMAQCIQLGLSLWVAQPAADPACVQPESVTRFELRSLVAEGHFPRYVDSQDQSIIDALAPLERHFDHEWLLGATAGELLPRIVATGRVFWRSFQGRALRFGAPRPVQFSWQVSSDGTQRLCCDSPDALAPPLVLYFGCEPAVYFDVSQSACGWVETSCPLLLLRRYWGARIAPESLASVNEQVAGALPQLRPIEIQRPALSSVRARLRLTAEPACELRFIYNDLPIEGSQPSCEPTVRVMPDSNAVVVYEIQRDHAAEGQLRAQLEQTWSDIEASTKHERWLTFVLRGVPVLQEQGWEVVMDADFPFRIVQPQQWYADLQSDRRVSYSADGHSADRHGADQGWFDLRLGVTVDDQTCNLLPALVSYLQSAGQPDAAATAEAGYCRIGECLLMRLEDGRYLPVPMARIERIAETLVELFESNSLNRRQALSLPASQAGRMLQLRDELPNLRCDDDSTLRLIDALQGSGITPLPAPAGFQATLRPYQQAGLGWLQFLRRCGLGGILADDMGLGKTLQTLAHLLLEKQKHGLRRPSLIVAPVSVIGNWQREMRRFTPELRLVVLHGSRRRESFAAVADSDVVVTGYPQLQLDSEFLLSCEFELVVLDEAQMIKNPRTNVAQVARALRAQQRLCLTGTPMENHLGELWSLLDFLQPGLLGDERQFQRLYRTPIERDGNVQRAAALSRRIAPFMLRRTKDAVAAELPEKTQIVEPIVLDEQQRDFYDAIRLAMHQRVQQAIEQQGLARSRITMLDALLKLRQACCDPRLVDLELGPDVAPRATIPSAKLQWLMTVLPELAAEGRRVLLFSQFTSMLSLIEAAVQQACIPYCLLTGATQQRSAQVEKFQSGTVPLFLISLKAGGTGLNLTAADTVIHYDPWWNPAVEAQATDRAHRIGQQQPVFVYKLIAQDTVEEKILKLQADKHALANQLYTLQPALTQFSAADLAELLAL